MTDAATDTEQVDLALRLASQLRVDSIGCSTKAGSGHPTSLRYSMFRAVRVIDEAELVDTYRQLGARLEGHPTPVLPWVDVATGSLGQGLPDAVGVALAGEYLDELDCHVWVLCGDSGTAEGCHFVGTSSQEHPRSAVGSARRPRDDPPGVHAHAAPQPCERREPWN